MIIVNLSITLFSVFTLIGLFFSYNIHPITGQVDIFENNSVSNNLVDIKNSEIGVDLKYPEDWTARYTIGSNNSLTYKEFDKIIEEDEDLANSSSSVRHQIYQNYSSNCIITDCEHIEDEFLQSYLRNIINFGGYMSIFDYLPTLALLPPLANSNDNFLESVNIASFVLPPNITLADFAPYYVKLLQIGDRTIDIDCDAADIEFGYPGCVYWFEIGTNLENMKYITIQLFIEKNDKVYVISYNSLAETYMKYLGDLKIILESFNAS